MTIHLPTDVDGNPLRLLMVHAHPDDETTTTGATAARYAAEGIAVHLVTCTRGERGEILDEDIQAGLAGLDQETTAQRLGRIRERELAAACAELNVTGWRFLGEFGQWWDSGMAGTPTAEDPRAFSLDDLAVQAEVMAAVIREIRPQVVVTYDERGGYGHPDHIRAHEVAMAGVKRAAEPELPGEPWLVAKVYACVIPLSYLGAGGRLLASAGVPDNPLDLDQEGLENVVFAVPDDQVAARIKAVQWLPAKARAMRAHRSQMPDSGWFFSLVDRGLFGTEHYRLLSGVSAPTPGERWEDDLFAGLRAIAAERDANAAAARAS